MDVQKLIDLLNQVENKESAILMEGCDCYQDWGGCITEESGKVLLGSEGGYKQFTLEKSPEEIEEDRKEGIKMQKILEEKAKKELVNERRRQKRRWDKLGIKDIKTKISKIA